MSDFQIDIYSHYFSITNFDINVKNDIITRLDDICTQMGYDRSSNYIVVRVFRSCTEDGKEFRYHISLLDHLKKIMLSLGYSKEGYTVIKHEPYLPIPIDAPIKEGWIPRDYQEPIIEYLLQDDPINFIPLATGKGKTSISLMAISKLRMKTMILVKSTFMDKWAFDVTNVLDIEPSKINVIRGGESLKALIDLNIAGEDDSAFIIMSLTTYSLYIDSYKKFHNEIVDLGYNCTPDQFLETCGIGIVLADEVHMCFGQQSEALLYSNCKKFIGLSATLINKDKNLERMYELVIPNKYRYKETLAEKYIYVTAISYNFNKPEKIRYKAIGSEMYSQAEFEKSIMRHVPTLNHYTDMVSTQVEKCFIDRYQKGDKCLVFAGTIKMCEHIRDKLREKFPNMWIEKYTSEDPYEFAIEPDIRVSTTGSIGTGIDIPKLTSTIMTVNVDSIQASQQSIGRLRKIPDRNVYFYYLYCQQINKHVRVHHSKRKTFSHIAKNFAERHYPMTI